MTDVAGTLPEPRTVSVTGDGLIADWWLELRADFSARNLDDLYSGDLVRVLCAAGALVVAHNMPDHSGQVALSLLDVVPADLCVNLVTKALNEIGKLPNR